MSLSPKPTYIENPERIPTASIPDNYVSYTLKHQEALPPITWKNWYKELHWLHVFILFVPPTIGIIGARDTPLQWNTAVWFAVYSLLTGFGKFAFASIVHGGTFLNRFCLGLTAGYHRLWAHRTYKATKTLEIILAILGAGVVEGSIAWWARGHRAHHRYTDTDLDPYNAHRGLFYSHIGWMIFKPRRKPGHADVSDLRQNPVVKWQHRYYLLLAFIMAVAVPTTVAGYGWGDWKGGYIYASMLRLVFVQHVGNSLISMHSTVLTVLQSTFCVNSLCHWLGEKPYDDKLTPKDCVLTAVITMGEGYHNFHHQFPMDYRNGYKWYQYDPTKWFLWMCEKIGLATHLKVSYSHLLRSSAHSLCSTDIFGQ